MRTVLGGERGEEGVEVFEARILNDYAAFPSLVFDTNLQPKTALQHVLCFADVGILCFLFYGFGGFLFRVEEALDVAFSLTY